MEFVTAAWILLAQEKRNGDLKPEDMKILLERNLFAPYKPEKKKDERKKEEKKEERKETPSAPVVTGFLKYPEGFRVLVTDRSKGASSQHAVGERLAGGTIVSIDNTKAAVLLPNGTKELRLGDPVTDAPIAGSSVAEIVGKIQGARRAEPGSDDVKKRMRDRMRKRWQGDEDEEETPRKRRRGEGR